MGTAAKDAVELARFCALLPDLEEQARDEGWLEELQRARGELQKGQKPAADVLKQFWQGLGLTARQRGADTMVDVLGQDAPPPPAGSYVCPRGRCSRAVHREPGGPMPMCKLFDEALKFR
jgi:hypothetical protein